MLVKYLILYRYKTILKVRADFTDRIKKLSYTAAYLYGYRLIFLTLSLCAVSVKGGGMKARRTLKKPLVRLKINSSLYKNYKQTEYQRYKSRR